jgi:hypothetical protein
MSTRDLNKSKLNGQTMKQMMAVLGTGILASVLFGCTQAGPQPPTVTTGYPYATYARGWDVPTPPNPAYRNWTTVQLQQRRTDLYNMVLQTQDRHGVAEYTYYGVPLPQQDEIRLVEAELSRRYQAGDKAAELKPAWPEERRHI